MHDRTARPLGPMVLVIVAVLLASAVFWVGFMLAPAAVLLVAYVAISAGDRARRRQLATLAPPGEITDNAQHVTGAGT